MEQLLNLLDGEPLNWINALPTYQERRVFELLGDGTDFESAAERWLKARPTDTAPFGTVYRTEVFREKLLQELEKFLCGSDEYEADREKLRQHQPLIHSYVVGTVSAAIAPALGSSGAFLAPAVALVFATIARMSLRAWCEARRAMDSGD